MDGHEDNFAIVFAAMGVSTLQLDTVSNFSQEKQISLSLLCIQNGPMKCCKDFFGVFKL